MIPKTRYTTGVVLKLNLYRRHLTSDQRKAIAVDLKKKFTVEAKEKQREAGKEYGEKHPKQELVAESPQALKPAPKSRDRAAQIMHVSARGVQDAQAVQDADPKLAKQVRDGTITLRKRLTCRGHPLTVGTQRLPSTYGRDPGHQEQEEARRHA